MKNKVLIIVCLFFLLTISVSAENKKCVSITGDGKHIGDEIACGTEHFYVVSNDDGMIKALAKYNLEIDSVRDNVEIDNYVTNDTKSIYKHPLVKEKLLEGYFLSGVDYDYTYDSNTRIANYDYKEVYFEKNAIEKYETIYFDTPVSNIFDALEIPEVKTKIEDNWIYVSNIYDATNSSYIGIYFLKTDYYQSKTIYVEGEKDSDYISSLPEVKAMTDEGWEMFSSINGDCQNSKCTKHQVFLTKKDYLKYDKYYQLTEHNKAYDEDGNQLFPVNNVPAYSPYIDIYHDNISKDKTLEIDFVEGDFYEGYLIPEDYRNIGFHYYLTSYLKTLKDDGYPIEKIGLISIDEINNMVDKKIPFAKLISEYECGSSIANIKNDLKDYNWLFDETYWTRSKTDCYSSLTSFTYIKNTGDIGTKSGFEESVNFDNAGVRPLIEIDAENIIYSITPKMNGEGNVTVSLDGASEGEEVNFEAKPEKGYTLGTIKVYDEEGNEIEIIDNSFIMPASNVTVEVEFIKEKETIIEQIIDNPNTLTFISLGTIIAFIISMSVILIIKRKKLLK